MASTDIITGARRDIFVGDIEENRPNSEAVNLKIAGNVQYLLDRVVLQEKFVFPGYINGSNFLVDYDNGLGGIAYITNDVKIREYYMAISYTGDSDTSYVNARVYDSLGGFKNTLFASTSLSISGSNGSNVVIGKKNITSTPSDITNNTGGHIVSTGTLNLTQLSAGDIVVPFIEGAANRARNLTFSLKLEEI